MNSTTACGSCTSSFAFLYSTAHLATQPFSLGITYTVGWNLVYKPTMVSPLMTLYVAVIYSSSMLSILSNTFPRDVLLNIAWKKSNQIRQCYLKHLIRGKGLICLKFE
eukprot:TRINITY_DN9984_c0_g1_i4.p1 TRINITY_DN9984_c0_g1~~TRINITY_DN9984_c0_g1_i4.p1  ORF type:complete len:108 (-),score=0.99 TRINITY_DN9984_c0_g1_i4:928-1251(-)